MKKFILLLFGLVVVLSCKTRKNAEPNTSDNDTVNIKNSDNKITGDAVYDRLTFYEKILLRPNFDYVKINSKITADNIRVSPLDAVIYIETDKKIWSTINFLFFNAARAIITPEGIKAIDKYNKTYIDSDFEYLNNLLNVNFIDYKSLEKLLVGRSFLPISNRNSSITKSENGYRLASITNQKFVTANAEREYKVEMQFSNEFNLNLVKLQDVKSNDAIEIVYGNWVTLENEIRFPQNVKIIIKGSKTSQILIENTKFGFTKMETPYSVPSSYKKIEIQ